MKAVYLKDKTGNKVVTTPYYRIGDLFLTTIADNPSSYLGGTWELFGPGRTLVCVDTSQTEFNSVKKIGGEKTHKLTISELAEHKHEGIYEYYSKKQISNRGDGGGGWNNINISQVTGSQDKAYSFLYTANTGGNQAHNNLQPFITCYIWIRTA